MSRRNAATSSVLWAYAGVLNKAALAIRAAAANGFECIKIAPSDRCQQRCARQHCERASCGALTKSVQMSCGGPRLCHACEGVADICGCSGSGAAMNKLACSTVPVGVDGAIPWPPERAVWQMTQPAAAWFAWSCESVATVVNTTSDAAIAAARGAASAIGSTCGWTMKH